MAVVQFLDLRIAAADARLEVEARASVSWRRPKDGGGGLFVVGVKFDRLAAEAAEGLECILTGAS